MSRRTLLLVLFAFLLAACGASTPTPAAIPTPVPSPTTLPTETIAITPALAISTETPTQVSTATLLPAITSTAEPAVETAVALMGPLGALTDIAQYYHPVGTPVKTWRDIPVMPLATAGQEFPPYVYSFTANATLDQARQFYAPLAPSLGIAFPPATGSAGTGAQAVHNITYLSPSPEVAIVLTSFDNDPAHVIVVFAKAP